jgi:hypothetical protein
MVLLHEYRRAHTCVHIIHAYMCIGCIYVRIYARMRLIIYACIFNVASYMNTCECYYSF